jgi:DNA-binding FrmR family transcriptional regulator
MATNGAPKNKQDESAETDVVMVDGLSGCKKHRPRSEETKKDVTRRLNRAIGQLNGVKAMVEEDRYCGDVLTQLSAAQSAIKAVSRVILDEHIHTCVVERVQENDLEVIDELMDLLKKFGG